MWLSYTGAKEFLFFDNLLKLWSHSLRAPRQDENCFRMSRNESRWKFYLQEFLIIFSYVILFLNLVAIKYIIFMKIISFYIKFFKRKNLLVIQLWRGEKKSAFWDIWKNTINKVFLIEIFALIYGLTYNAYNKSRWYLNLNTNIVTYPSINHVARQLLNAFLFVKFLLLGKITVN